MFKIKIGVTLLSLGLATMVGIEAQAHSDSINNITDFYDYYEQDFTQEQREIIQGIFTNIQPYLDPNGLEHAIQDGFIPLTTEWKDHGTHWFNPTPAFVDLTNIQANQSKPVGLNIDKNGKLVGVFWAEELYQPIVPLLQSLDLTSVNREELTSIYGQYQATTRQPIPDIFAAFGEEAQWHNHQNVIMENLGAKDAQGQLDPQMVNFRQSLSNQQIVDELLSSLATEDIVTAPLESDNNLGDVPFNQGMSPGFHMIHMWVGLGNHDGLFAGTNHAIEVSDNAIYESETFADGSGGHDHSGGHPDPSGDEVVPEPFTILGTAFVLGYLPALKKARFKTPF